MILKTIDVTDGEEAAQFRGDWKQFCAYENDYLSRGQMHEVSDIQAFFIDAFTCEQLDTSMKTLQEIEGQLPAQMELEALFRSRSRALASHFGRVSAAQSG